MTVGPDTSGVSRFAGGPAANDASVRQGGHVAGMQRRRLLTAMFELAFEGGIQTVSVALLCQRAGLSRRTFYELFDSREECVHAAFADAIDTAQDTVVGATVGVVRWREQVRAGLAALLGLLDREPGMGRLLVVEALGCGVPTLELRREVLDHAATLIDEGRSEARNARRPPPLTAEGIVGAVLSVIHARMLARDSRPLTELTGSLMALIVHPYLGSAAAQRELDTRTDAQPLTARRLPADPFKDLSIRLTYRTACVLSSIAHAPGASNKQVADSAGITDPGQISRLLTRLQRNGLIQDTGIGPTKGMARAWSLTQHGHDILQATGQT